MSFSLHNLGTTNLFLAGLQGRSHWRRFHFTHCAPFALYIACQLANAASGGFELGLQESGIPLQTGFID